MVETSPIAFLEPRGAPSPGRRPAVPARRAADRGCVALVGAGGVLALADVTLVESTAGAHLAVLECRRSSCVDPGDGRALGPTGCLSSHGRAARGDLPPTLIHHACTDESEAQVFVVSSRAWLLRQRASNDRARRKTRGALDGLARRVAAGELCDPDHIGRLAARILAREDAHPHFDWRHKDRSFLYVERVRPTGQRAVEGTYLVRIPARAPTPLRDAPGEVNDTAVRAPIFVAALAFMVERVLRTSRHAGPLRVFAAEALDALEPLSIVDLGAPGR